MLDLERRKTIVENNTIKKILQENSCGSVKILNNSMNPNALNKPVDSILDFTFVAGIITVSMMDRMTNFFPKLFEQVTTTPKLQPHLR